MIIMMQYTNCIVKAHVVQTVSNAQANTTQVQNLIACLTQNKTG